MDRLEDMKTFVRVVEAGSFTAAAEQLRMARSAVSRRISDLEHYLGVRLLQRTTRRLNITETGRFYYERSIRILDDLEDMEHATRGRDASLAGTLRVAGPLSFGQKHLIGALNTFLDQHPQLDLDLRLDDHTIDLVEEGMDLGLRIGDHTHASLIARKLTIIRRTTLASPEYLKKHGEPKTPEEFEANHLCLAYSNMPESLHWQYKTPDGDFLAVRPRVRLRANNGDVLLRAALDGKGIVGLPTFITYEAIRSGALKPILKGFCLQDRTAHAVYAPGRQLSHKVRVFIDFLVGYFGKTPDMPYWDA